jgi:RNA polymerase sigma-70 factor, ECF subfamily
VHDTGRVASILGPSGGSGPGTPLQPPGGRPGSGAAARESAEPMVNATPTLVHGAPLGDDILVERILRGDDAAFRELYHRYARYVAGVVVRLMGHDLELDDVVQDTFVRAAERLDTLRSGAHVRPWLVTIAVRFARERMRRHHRRGHLQRAYFFAAPTMSDPRDRAPAEELYAALDRLPEKLRTPWCLARIEGESLENVAAVCDVSLATVKRRIAQAQRRIDRRMEGTA